MTEQSRKAGDLLIALNPVVDFERTKKIRCPECRRRIFDVVLTEKNDCRHNLKVVIDKDSKSKIAVKCSKCGQIVGITLFEN